MTIVAPSQTSISIVTTESLHHLLQSKNNNIKQQATIATIKENLNSVTESSLQHLNTQQKYNILHEILTATPEIRTPREKI